MRRSYLLTGMMKTMASDSPSIFMKTPGTALAVVYSYLAWLGRAQVLEEDK